LSGLVFDLKTHWSEVEQNDEFTKGVMFGLEETFALITSLRAELKPQFEGEVPVINAQPADEPEPPNG